MSQFKGLALGGNREKYTKKEYLTYGSIGLLILGLPVLYAFELEYFPRYTNISAFLIFAFTAGLFSGSGIAYFFRNRANNATETMQIYIFCIITSLIFSPLFFSLVNRILPLNTYKKEVQIINVEQRISSRFGAKKGEKLVSNQLKISYLKEGKRFDYTTKSMVLKDAKRGDFVEVEFKKGLLGFEYILPE